MISITLKAIQFLSCTHYLLPACLTFYEFELLVKTNPSYYSWKRWFYICWQHTTFFRLLFVKTRYCYANSSTRMPKLERAWILLQGPVRLGFICGHFAEQLLCLSFSTISHIGRNYDPTNISITLGFIHLWLHLSDDINYAYPTLLAWWITGAYMKHTDQYHGLVPVSRLCDSLENTFL